MRKLLLIIVISFLISPLCVGVDIKKEIEEDVGVSSLEDIVPESLSSNDILDELDFSYYTAEEGLKISTLFGKTLNLFLSGLKAELYFISISKSLRMGKN